MIKEIKKCTRILPLKYTRSVEFGKVVLIFFLRKLKYLRCRKYTELALFYYNLHLNTYYATDSILST